MKNRISIWPDVATPSGRKQGFELASAGSLFLSLVCAVAAVVAFSGAQERIGFAAELPARVVAGVFTLAAVTAAILAIWLRKEAFVAAFMLAALVVAGFFANAWWGSGRGLWVAVVVVVAAIQGVRAAIVERTSRRRK